MRVILSLVTTAPTSTIHTLDAEQASRALDTDVAHGLSTAEAARRIEVHGQNRLAIGRREPAWRRLLAQFQDLFVLLLLAAAAISVWLGEPHDVAAIATIVVLNATLGFVHERRAERALEALQELAAPRARVRRDGHVTSIPAEDLVPGDVVLLEAGDLVPADLRLVRAADLRAQESALTGESEPVEKDAHAIDAAETPVADRRGMAWKGTLCVHGHATGLVSATGGATELGRIAAMLREERGVETPLQRRLARFARRTALAVGVLCALLFAWGLLRGEPPAFMFLTAVSLAVAAIPEALPAMTTLTLSLGARRMARRNALIRHLPAVEALGSVTWICADKTGTLTENRMRVRVWSCAGERFDEPISEELRGGAWHAILEACALNAEVERAPGGDWRGDPTEVALVEAADAAGVRREALAADWPRVAELPFSSERGRMTTLHAHEGVAVALMKGAPERVLPRCSSAFAGAALDAPAVLAEAHALAASGLRVLAFARRRLPADHACHDERELEHDFEFLGLVGMIDPPRSGAREAVATCRTAGIRVAMVTGDHPGTARAIAREVGILDDDSEGAVITGPELAALDARALSRRIDAVRVFARVAPEQKIAIVRTLQERGEHVAMTGDGVNDAPALRRADIGVAMGRGGTDVAREASAMVLLDDDFQTIVAAVREGRRIDDNLRKFLKYLLTGNVGEIAAVALAPALGLPLPLLPLQILWVNLVTDGLPGLALAVERAESDFMRRPPGSGLLTAALGWHAAVIGTLIGLSCLAAHALAGREDPERARTMAFTVLTLAQMGHVLAIRSDREPLLSLGWKRGRLLLGAVGLTFLLQAALLYLPPLAKVMGTVPLDVRDAALCLALSALTPIVVESQKAWRNSRRCPGSS